MRLSVHSRWIAQILAWLCFAAWFSASRSYGVFTEQGGTILRDSSGNLIPGGFNITGRSASLADIDNDGDLDLLFQASTTSTQKLFRNNNINLGGTASNTFTDVTSTMWQAGVSSSQWSAAWGDYDGDGNVDVLIGEDNSGQPRGRLMRNTGTGFTDVSASTGLNYNGFAQNVAWVDINNDHLLDMVIGMENGQPNQIYLQNSSHHFAPVAPANGIQ